MSAQLPPLILHPFGGTRGCNNLLDGSRAWLSLQGVLPSEDDQATLEARMLAGRYQELTMLLFVGKDIARWLSQCAEFMDHDRPGSGYTEQSFASLLVERPPAAVQSKLQTWGVSDFRTVFSRALGIYSLFEKPPELESLSATFVRHYHRFADYAFICYQHLKPSQPLEGEEFPFEIFASEEYARLLSNEWEKA